MKKILLGVVIIVVLIAGVWYLVRNAAPMQTGNPAITPSVTKPTTSQIIFPRGGETLMEGKTYTLRWTPGSGTTQIFLIDTALESQGVSVSIADRVYNIPNSGNYSYTVPSGIPDSTYKFQIGELNSSVFKIASSQTSGQISFCSPSDLQASLVTEGAAGSIYGMMTLKNTSASSCQIIGKNHIDATYTAQTIQLKPQGGPGPESITLTPQQTIYSQVRYPNGPQCNSATTQSTITFRYRISTSDSITFTDSQGNTKQHIITCSSPTDTTDVSVWSLSLQPISQ